MIAMPAEPARVKSGTPFTSRVTTRISRRVMMALTKPGTTARYTCLHRQDPPALCHPRPHLVARHRSDCLPLVLADSNVGGEPLSFITLLRRLAAPLQLRSPQHRQYSNLPEPQRRTGRFCRTLT